MIGCQIEISTQEDSDIKFSNIAGNEEAKENIMELVDFIKIPKSMRNMELGCQKE